MVTNDIFVEIFLYAKESCNPKCQLLISKHESVDLKHHNDFKTFIKYLHDTKNMYENIDKYNPNKKCKILMK